MNIGGIDRKRKNAFAGEIHDAFNKSTNGFLVQEYDNGGNGIGCIPDCRKSFTLFHRNKLVKAVKMMVMVWKLCEAADHFDSEDHTEIFGPDARPRPPGKTKPAKKTKSETTESSAGSGSGSMKDVLNEDLRQEIQAVNR
ncbi:hypothetical protein Tco_0824643, partial [Tanacetum coccineum]